MAWVSAPAGNVGVLAGLLSFVHEFCYGVSGVSEMYVEVTKVSFNLNR
jgi:hypothetical protein